MLSILTTKRGEKALKKHTNLDGDANITINIKKMKEKPGKEIVMVFEDCELLLDNRCLGKDTEACDKCKLKFRCYTSDALRINFKDEIIKMPLPSQRPTIGEIVQWYFQRNGVDQSLTKIVAYDTIEEDGKAPKKKKGKK